MCCIVSFINKVIFNMLESRFFWNNDLKSWLIAAIVLFGGVLMGFLIYWITSKIVSRLVKKTKTKIDDILVSMLKAPFVFGAVIGSIWAAIMQLEIGERFRDTLGGIYTILVIINITWTFSIVIITIIDEYLLPYSDRDDAKFDKNAAIIIKRFVNYLIWIIGVILALHNAGVDIAALLTGLGIGGIAFALAAQDTIKNLLGGITLFADRPFKMGDRVLIGEVDGFVMNIGLRSIRILTLDDRMLSIPNSKVVDSTVINVTSEPSRRVKANIGLTYDTTPEKMNLAISILNNLPKSIPQITDCVNVSFNELGSYSMNILFIYRIKKEEDVLKTQSLVNLSILSQFNQNGLTFAFPTQTIYTKS